MANNFKPIREQCRRSWLSATGRRRYINDVVADTVECDLQNNHVPQNMHNSMFCSIAEWCTNITDLLYESTYDRYVFRTPRYNQALFRYYTRVLLLTSEILTDFQDAIRAIEKLNKTGQARTLLNAPALPFTCDNLFAYINVVCKHKMATSDGHFRYHICNNHISYVFEDDDGYTPSVNRVRVSNISNTPYAHGMELQVPSLQSILDQIVHGLSVLEARVKKPSNPAHARTVLANFEVPLNTL